MEGANVMQTEDELLAGLDDSDIEQMDTGVKEDTRMEFSAPYNTEAMMDKVSSESKTRLASVDSEMDTETVHLHLTLETTGTDEDETCGAIEEGDKENQDSANTNNNAEDSKKCDSEVVSGSECVNKLWLGSVCSGVSSILGNYPYLIYSFPH